MCCFRRCLVQPCAPLPQKVYARPCTLATRLMYTYLVLQRPADETVLQTLACRGVTLDCWFAPCPSTPGQT